MRAWLLQDFTGLDALKLSETPDPTPEPNEALVEIEYAALNPADRFLAQRQYPAKPKLPHILGRDGIGKVIAVGAEVRGFAVGDAALILRSEIGVNRCGTLAQRVAVPEESLVKPPRGWSAEESAAAPLVYLTAYQALTQWGDLPPSLALVTGASGGVGVATVQLGQALGHAVVGLSRSSEKANRLKKLGAAEVFDPADKDWAKKFKESFGDRRIDLAVDNVAGAIFSDLLNVMGMHGRISVVGRSAGGVPDFNTAALFFRRLRIGGVAMGTFTPAESQAAWQTIVQLLDRRNYRPVIDRVFAFDDLIPAFNRLEQGPMGKVLIKVGG